MGKTETLLKIKCNFPGRYYLYYSIGEDVLKIRPILREDMGLALVVLADPDLEVQKFLMSRCINKVNTFYRAKWGYIEWYKFICSLNLLDKHLYMSKLREITYMKFYKKENFPIYF